MEGQRERVAENRQDRSIGSLIKELADESSRLIGEEVQLAKAEIGEKIDVYKSSIVRMVIGAGFIAAAVIVVVAALNRGLTVLLAGAMSMEIAVWVAPLIVAVVSGLVGWGIVKGAQKAIKDEGVTPQRTLDSLHGDLDFVKQEVKEVRNG